MNPPQPDLEPITCQNCFGQIRPSTDSPIVICPECGAENRPAPAPPRAQPLALPLQDLPITPPLQIEPGPPVIALNNKSSISVLGPIILFVISCGLILQGFSVEIGSKNATNQVYAAINYCSGFILLGAGFILDGLRTLSRNQ